MRFALVLFVMSACDLQPAKQKSEPVSTALPATRDAAVAEPPPSPIPPGNTVDAGVRKPPVPTTEACATTAAHITKLMIEAVPNPTDRSAQEQDRAKTIRRIAEACTKDGWTEATRACFLAGKTRSEIDVCGRDLKQPE